MKNLRDFYFHLSCPPFNGIIIPDEIIVPMKFNISWGPPIEYKVFVENSINYDIVKTLNELVWKDCAVLFCVEISVKEVIILSGESDYGSDGFVAVLNARNKMLIWIGIFDTSDPFDKLFFEEETNCIIAYSTNGAIWRFPIEKPYELSINPNN